MHKINFNSADRECPLPEEQILQDFIVRLFDKEKKYLSNIQYVFCSDDFLLKINRDHLQHDYYTDIITFDLSEDSHTIGEIYISIDRVRENAMDLHISFEQELLRVVFHGALHLCGYGDKTPTEEKLMRQKEDEYLEQFALLRQ